MRLLLPIIKKKKLIFLLRLEKIYLEFIYIIQQKL